MLNPFEDPNEITEKLALPTKKGSEDQEMAKVRTNEPQI